MIRIASLRSIVSLMAALAAAGCVKPQQAPPPAMPAPAVAAAPEAAAPVAPPPPAPVAAAPVAAAPVAAAPVAAGPMKPAKPVEPPPPAWKKGENPFVGVKYWRDPYAPAFLKSKLLSKTDPEQSALLKKIADNGGADWIGDWTPNIENWVSRRVTAILKDGALPLFIAYNIPKRDCGQYSAGGADKADGYRTWISAFAKGIGDRRAVVVLEPDALGLLKKCLSEADQKQRLELVRFAVHTFSTLGNTAVYLDAGNSGWIPAPDMTQRLKAAGIDEAEGFALNVSNYKSTEASIKFGKDLSKRLGGKHFVIDTSRNGNGPPATCKNPEDESCWCNPPGRALGSRPTSETGIGVVDAFLWLKKPGESDGTCNGGPKAGVFWQDKALELARNAKY